VIQHRLTRLQLLIADWQFEIYADMLRVTLSLVYLELGRRSPPGLWRREPSLRLEWI
jgi:hypothetical protein